MLSVSRTESSEASSAWSRSRDQQQQQQPPGGGGGGREFTGSTGCEGVGGHSTSRLRPLVATKQRAQVQPRVVGSFYLLKSGAIKCKSYVSKSYILKGTSFSLISLITLEFVKLLIRAKRDKYDETL